MYTQIFAGGPDPDPNSLWKITFGAELATYNNTSIQLLHVNSNQPLGIYDYHIKSPLTEQTEGNKLKRYFISFILYP